MPAIKHPKAVGEGSPRRSVPEEEQVRLASAVRRPEPCQRDGCSRLNPKALRPAVLPRNAVVTEPDLLGCRVCPQVINMPVGTVGRLQVMCQPGVKTTGTVGAADVDVIVRLELEVAKLANGDRRSDAR